MGPGFQIEKWLLREKRKNIQNHLLFSQHVCIHFETTPWKTWAFTLRLSNRWTTHRRWEFRNFRAGGGGKVIGSASENIGFNWCNWGLKFVTSWKSGGFLRIFVEKWQLKWKVEVLYMLVSQIGRGFGGLSWVILVVYSLILVGDLWFTTP